MKLVFTLVLYGAQPATDLFTLEGRVLGVDGRPAASVDVVALFEKSIEGSLLGAAGRTGKTDRDGRFRLERLPAGAYAIWAGTKRGPEAAKKVTVPFDGTLELQLEATRPPGRPDAGNRSSEPPREPEGPYKLLARVVDDRGEVKERKWSFTTKGQVTVRIEEPGYVPVFRTLTLKNDVEDLGTITLERPVQLTVRVKDAEGRPIARAELSQQGMPVRSTGADGSAVLPMLTRDDLTVTAPGFLRAKLRPDAGVRELDVTLARGARLVVRVRDQNGPATVMLRSCGWQGVVTGEDDRSGLPPGPCTVLAGTGDVQYDLFRSVTLVDGQTTTVDIFLEQPPRSTITVKAPNGMFAAAFYGAQPLPPERMPMPNILGMTPQIAQQHGYVLGYFLDGGWVFRGLRPGPHQLVFVDAQARSKTVALDVPDRDATLDLPR